MKQTFRLRLCCALCAFSALAVTGCSTTAPSPVASANATTAVAPATSPLVIGYAEGQEQALTDLKLKPTFEAYWQAHSQRNWEKLFTLEYSPNVPLSKKFYLPYHAKAWPVLNVKVLSVEQDKATGEVLVSQQVTYHDSDKEQAHTAARRDKWVLVEAQWRHLVTDPMLTIKPQSGSASDEASAAN